MKQLQPFGTNEALGLASIIQAATGRVFKLDQDLKGRWHVWASAPNQPDQYDSTARQLEPDL